MGRSDDTEEFKPRGVFLAEIALAKDIIASGIPMSTHAKVSGLAEKETPIFNRRTFLIRCLLEVLEAESEHCDRGYGLSTECIYYVYFKIAQCLQIRCHYRWNDIVLFTEVLFPSSRVVLRKSDDANQSYHRNLRLSPDVDEICFNNDHDECDLACSEVADVDAFVDFVNGCRDEEQEASESDSDHPPSLLLGLGEPPSDKASRLLDEVFGSESRDEANDEKAKDEERSGSEDGLKRASQDSSESEAKQICKDKGRLKSS